MIITEIIVTVCTSLPYGIQFQTTYKTEWISFFIRITMYFEASSPQHVAIGDFNRDIII